GLGVVQRQRFFGEGLDRRFEVRRTGQHVLDGGVFGRRRRGSRPVGGDVRVAQVERLVQRFGRCRGREIGRGERLEFLEGEIAEALEAAGLGRRFLGLGRRRLDRTHLAQPRGLELGGGGFGGGGFGGGSLGGGGF